MDLKQNTFSCRVWQIFWLPRSQAASILFIKMNRMYDLIDEYFYTSNYKKAYAQPIIPFPRPDSIDDEGIIIRPPEFHQTCGRPKKEDTVTRQENTTQDEMWEAWDCFKSQQKDMSDGAYLTILLNIFALSLVALKFA